MDQQELTDLTDHLRAFVCGGRRDSKRELVLLRRIRSLPQATRLELLIPLFNLNWRIALVFAHRVQLSRAAYLAIFLRGLDEADASTIYQWMDATVVHLGWRKVFSVLRRELTVKPRRVAFALYQVPGLCRGKQTLSGSLPTTALLDEFCQLVELCYGKGYRICDESTYRVIRDRARRTDFLSLFHS